MRENVCGERILVVILCYTIEAKRTKPNGARQLEKKLDKEDAPDDDVSSE